MFSPVFIDLEVVSVSTLVSTVLDNDWPEGAERVFITENVNNPFSLKFNVVMHYKRGKSKHPIEKGAVYATLTAKEYRKANRLKGSARTLYIWWLILRNIGCLL